MTMRSRELAAVALLAAAASSGCGQKKIAECNAVVGMINNAVVGLEKTPKNEADPTGLSDLRAMADAMDKVASDIGAVQITLPELKKLRDRYQNMATDIAKAERELATAHQDKSKAEREVASAAQDPARRAAAEQTLDAAVKRRSAADATLDTVVKQEDPLVDQINKYCQAP
jgi:chromosome segregation ATPase